MLGGKDVTKDVRKEGTNSMSKISLEDPASHPMSVAVHPKRPLPGPALSPTAGVLGHLASPALKAGASPCHPQCLGPTGLERTAFLPLSQCSRMVDQPEAPLLSNTEQRVRDTADLAGNILPPATGSEHHFNHC